MRKFNRIAKRLLKASSYTSLHNILTIENEANYMLNYNLEVSKTWVRFGWTKFGGKLFAQANDFYAWNKPVRKALYEYWESRGATQEMINEVYRDILDKLPSMTNYDTDGEFVEISYGNNDIGLDLRIQYDINKLTNIIQKKYPTMYEKLNSSNGIKQFLKKCFMGDMQLEDDYTEFFWELQNEDNFTVSAEIFIKDLDKANDMRGLIEKEETKTENI